MMWGVDIDEVATGGEAGFVPVFDMRAGYLVLSETDARRTAARLDV
ncbi:hypothetical protein MON41_17510 [Roseomonas vastitatis]|uniref:Uncharacterized protein n=1 Tax=Teichococcus vastitatis TaxID=2307076 RepID=A0ABS9W891_9PROT|nr:hypothetical protein [Pseudoroseomonas vastitatis]MCI0755512.1 hypothetical protein [Pseudoroseomonas vastitatis]